MAWKVEAMTAFGSVGHGHSVPPEIPSNTRGPSFQPVEPDYADENSISPVSAQFYQAAVAHAGIPVVPLDVTGRILAWNAAAERLFGRNAGEAVGRPLETLIPSEYRPIAGQAFQRTLQQRSVNIYEMSIV